MIRDPGNARRKLPRYRTTCLGNFSHLILAVRILNLSKLKETQSSWEKRGRWEKNRNTRKSLGKISTSDISNINTRKSSYETNQTTKRKERNYYLHYLGPLVEGSDHE